MSGATFAGRSRSDSTAGARRRYQRRLPRVMARTAARWGEFCDAARALSDDCPTAATDARARAASARAAAPGGAPGRKARRASGDMCAASPAAGRRARGRPQTHAPRPACGRAAAPAVRASCPSPHCTTIASPDTPTTVPGGLPSTAGAPSTQTRAARMRSCVVLNAGLGNRPGIEGAHLALDLGSRLLPVDGRLGLADLGGVAHAFLRLRRRRQCTRGERIQCLGAESRRRASRVRRAGIAAVSVGADGNGPLQQNRPGIKSPPPSA